MTQCNHWPNAMHLSVHIFLAKGSTQKKVVCIHTHWGGDLGRQHAQLGAETAPLPPRPSHHAAPPRALQAMDRFRVQGRLAPEADLFLVFSIPLLNSFCQTYQSA